MNEDVFLEMLNQYFSASAPGVLAGRGDDCAWIENDSSLAISVDLFLEHVHFLRSYFQPEDIGYKALAVNLSDLAACGARPYFFLLSLIWPSYLDLNFAQKMFKTMAELAKVWGLVLVGGDLSRGQSLGLSITIAGKVQARFIPRKQAKPGDVVFVLGELGLSHVGLLVLKEKIGDKQDFGQSIAQHLRPRIYLKESFALNPYVKSMLDVSDGVGRDLFRLLPKGLGVELKEINLHPEVKKMARLLNVSALDLALSGGEDFALLGIAEEKDLAQLKKIGHVWELGRVVAREGIFWRGQKLSCQGFDHFA